MVSRVVVLRSARWLGLVIATFVFTEVASAQAIFQPGDPLPPVARVPRPLRGPPLNQRPGVTTLTVQGIDPLTGRFGNVSYPFEARVALMPGPGNIAPLNNGDLQGGFIYNIPTAALLGQLGGGA